MERNFLRKGEEQLMSNLPNISLAIRYERDTPGKWSACNLHQIRYLQESRYKETTSCMVKTRLSTQSLEQMSGPEETLSQCTE